MSSFRMAKAAPRLRPIQHEKVEQAHILQLAAVIGAKFYVLGTRRSRGKACPSCRTFVPEDQGTRQTPGISDLVFFLKRPPARPEYPHARLLLFWETKAARGRRSADQDEFASWVADAGVAYGCGTYNDFIAWCVTNGYCKTEQFPHYRQPKEPV